MVEMTNVGGDHHEGLGRRVCRDGDAQREQLRGGVKAAGLDHHQGSSRCGDHWAHGRRDRRDDGEGRGRGGCDNEEERAQH